MKIKGSIKGLKINSAFIVFAIGTVLALGIRIYQSVSGLINFETGFYNETHITTALLYVVLAVSAIIISVISYLAGEVPQEKMPENKNIPLAVVSLLFAVALGYVAIGNYQSFSYSLQSYNSSLSFSYVEKDTSVLSFLMKSGAIPQLAQAVFAVLSAVYFLVLLFKYSGLRNVNLTKIKPISLCPLFWATFRMIERFTRTISFMEVSDLLLELFMIAFMMMFFMYFAQVSSQVNAVAISYKLFAYGLIGSMLSFVIACPRVVLHFTNTQYRLLAEQNLLESPLEISDIFFGLFVLVFLISFLSVPRIRNMTLKQTEKLIKE